MCRVDALIIEGHFKSRFERQTCGRIDALRHQDPIGRINDDRSEGIHKAALAVCAHFIPLCALRVLRDCFPDKFFAASFQPLRVSVPP